MGVNHGDEGDESPTIWSGGIVPQILSCCKILSTRLLALQCRKMCFFCVYSRTFIVSPAMHPHNYSQIYAYEQDSTNHDKMQDMKRPANFTG